MPSSDSYSHQLAHSARDAARRLATVPTSTKNAWLTQVAQQLRLQSETIIQANQKDLDAGAAAGLSAAMLDRLKLDGPRIDALAAAVEHIRSLPDPVGEVIDGHRRPNGLFVSRVRVPLGVVFFIYESRPNVTIDAAALCVKSGNAVILRGGSEAFHSNVALQSIIASSLKTCGLPENAVQLVNTTDRSIVGELLGLGQYIDVTIPRGGRSLIERVTNEATMPVIKHFDGICHVYFDATADLKMATDIIVNSKCQRPGVCNAAETLLIHADAAERLWPSVAAVLQQKKVELRCCPQSLKMISGGKPATDQDYRTEHLDLILNVRIVDSVDHAMDHIRIYGSGHTEAIVTRCVTSADRFQNEVDSSAVVVNASTRFNDGGELGLGAEIGISTDRFHARGPCGMRELCSYKFIVRGDGQVR
ncbi:MAG: glutamate-5-semialdehyde dehydrogenase [Planctomycetaceae bacterium]|nr:glutamate-5-semialdehyde dehydrogenase [Planctomycetaceae bacterium]